MQHGEMTYRDPVTKGQPDPFVGVQNRTILHIGLVADTDDIVITAHDRVVPDTRLVSENDRTDDRGAIRHKIITTELDPSLSQGLDHDLVLYWMARVNMCR